MDGDGLDDKVWLTEGPYYQNRLGPVCVAYPKTIDPVHIPCGGPNIIFARINIAFGRADYVMLDQSNGAISVLELNPSQAVLTIDDRSLLISPSSLYPWPSEYITISKDFKSGCVMQRDDAREYNEESKGPSEEHGRSTVRYISNVNVRGHYLASTGTTEKMWKGSKYER